jgi:hypothetical protein
MAIKGRLNIMPSKVVISRENVQIPKFLNPTSPNPTKKVIIRRIKKARYASREYD